MGPVSAGVKGVAERLLVGRIACKLGAKCRETTMKSLSARLHSESILDITGF